MAEDYIKQTQNLLKGAKNIALLLPAELSLDEYCAAVALKLVFQRETVAVSIFSDAKKTPEAPFLSEQPEIRNRFSKSDNFAVKISTAHAQPSELRYELEPDGLVVYLKTKSGEFLAEDVSVLPLRQKFDLFVSLGVSKLEQLGGLYTDNAAVFFDTPHINIDTKADNEYFGTVNAVSVTTSSICEIVLEILADQSLSESVATALLAGIIDRTHSFRDPRTNPKTLAAAAQLVTAGAKQQEIIHYLFKTKPFPVLQLWGRALARLAVVSADSLIHTVVTKRDLEKTQADASMLPEVLRDIIEIVTGYSLVALFAELPEQTQLLLAGLPHANLQSIAAKLGAPAGPTQSLVGQFEYLSVTFKGKATTELQEELLQAIRSK